MKLGNRHFSRLHSRVSWGIGVGTLMTFFAACSADPIERLSGNDDDPAAFPWEAGEDCRNWGCAEEAFAKQSVIAPPSNAQACSTGAECASGFCVDGVCCDSACTGTCMACTAAKKGQGADGTCSPIVLYGNPDKECSGGSCDGAGACKMYNGNTCSIGTQCLSNNCADGFCCGAPCTETCRACSIAKRGGGFNGQCGPIASGTDPDNECSTGECNGAAACTVNPSLPNASACSTGMECLSGHCVDGVCCDTACSGTCEACTAAKKFSGSDGTCGFIAFDKNPDGECIGGKCSGSGTCMYYNGSPCSTLADCLSNYCVDGFCCGNACTGTCQSCSAAKKGGGFNGQCGNIATGLDPDDECASSCGGNGACMTLLADGNACTNGALCSSGFCVDGVCCASACSGTCLACNLPGLEGACSNTPVGQSDPNGSPACTEACNGAGLCKAQTGQACTSGIDCASAVCINKVCAAPGPTNGPLKWLTALHDLYGWFGNYHGLHDIAARDDGTIVGMGRTNTPLTLAGFSLSHISQGTVIPFELNVSSTGVPTALKLTGYPLIPEDKFNGANVWRVGGDVAAYYGKYSFSTGFFYHCSGYLKKFGTPTWTKDPCPYDNGILNGQVTFIPRATGDSAGNLLVRWNDHWRKYTPTGATSFTIPGTGYGTRQGALGAGNDIYWIELEPGNVLHVRKTGFGGSVVWDRSFLVATSSFWEQSIAVDGSGNVVIAFPFNGTINLGNGPLTATGTEDLALAKFDPNGNAIWSKHFGGPGFNLKKGRMVLTGTHDMALVGYFAGTADFGDGALSGSAFIAKFDTLGNIVWHVDLVDDEPMGAMYSSIKLSGHPSGAVYIASWSRTLDFGFGPVLASGRGFLVAKYGGL